MTEELPEVLEPDIDETCYLFSQVIMRMMDEEDAISRARLKQSQELDSASPTNSPAQDEDSDKIPEETIDQ